MEINVKLMCAKAQVDLERVSAEAEARFQAGLRDAVVATYNEGKRLAMERLHTTSKDWLKAFNMTVLSDNAYLIQLKDDVKEEHGLPPTWIEGGFAAFDMKPKMLAGPRVHQGKNGPYLTVPFEHAVSAKPTNLGEAVMQQGLKNVIRQNKMNKTFKDKSGTPLQGNVARIQPGSAQKAFSESGKALMKQKTNYLEGLTKYQKTYAKRTESRYMTFRRVSKKSPASSWHHPGFEGAKVFPTLEKYLTDQVELLINNILR